jgi:hypothetical protein
MCNVNEDLFFRNPKEGDLMIWWIPQVPMDPYCYPVKTIREAKLVLEILRQYDAFQFDHNVKPDYSSVGGLEVFEDGYWTTWYNEDGDDIDEVDDNGMFVEVL